MTDAERRAALEAVAAEVRSCTRCRLHQGRTKAVPGEGTAATEVMFVGEGPGFNEDKQGRPFVGQAGALLEELLASISWRRDEVFITNVVKCRPPGNRDPEPDEIATCAPYLTRQLAALDPALVVTLGRFSMARFNPGARIGQVHGTYRPAEPGSGASGAMTFAMYHPAAALHQGSLKQTLFADMQSVPPALTAAREARLSAEAAAQATAAGARASEGQSETLPASPRAVDEPASARAAESAEAAEAAQGVPCDSAPASQLSLF
jgi:uracil-DNA glycosylase family 4